MIPIMSFDQLRKVREAWARVEAAEAALPLDLGLADRVRVYEMLYQACRPQLAATASLFGELRQREMIALQARLRRLVDQDQDPTLRQGDVSDSG
jgi:hypothetical protein